MSARYWLVKVPEGDCPWAEEIILRLDTYGMRPAPLPNVEVVEIVPEHRESNWMERAIAAKYAGGQRP